LVIAREWTANNTRACLRFSGFSDAKQLIVECASRDYGPMNPLGKSGYILIVRASYDTRVLRRCLVQLDEVAAIDRENRAAKAGRIR
jgi:hypothetical protein